MRLLVTTGVWMPSAFSASRNFLLTQVKAPRGTLVAMVGTRASCQPMPVFSKVAPAALMARASCKTSGHELPSGIKSIRLMR